jgi:ABC-type Fe3+ transport system permease subunit
VLASAFAVAFGVFIAAFAALCVVIVSWAVRRDRARWREWRDDQDRRER